MTLDSSYIGYVGCLGIDLFKSVLMYYNGAICLIKLLFKMGLFTVWPVSECASLCVSLVSHTPWSHIAPTPSTFQSPSSDYILIIFA